MGLADTFVYSAFGNNQHDRAAIGPFARYGVFGMRSRVPVLFERCFRFSINGVTVSGLVCYCAAFESKLGNFD